MTAQARLFAVDTHGRPAGRWRSCRTPHRQRRCLPAHFRLHRIATRSCQGPSRPAGRWGRTPRGRSWQVHLAGGFAPSGSHTHLPVSSSTRAVTPPRVMLLIYCAFPVFEMGMFAVVRLACGDDERRPGAYCSIARRRSCARRCAGALRFRGASAGSERLVKAPTGPERRASPASCASWFGWMTWKGSFTARTSTWKEARRRRSRGQGRCICTRHGRSGGRRRDFRPSGGNYGEKE